MRYSVIIATWNAGDALRDCLESVTDQRLDGPLETIVVDNASTDGTPELLARLGDRVRTIRSEENLGYSGGINHGAQAATGDVIFIVNSDTVLRPKALQRLADALRDSAVGLAGPRYEWPDGTLQHGCASHPTVAGALLMGAGIHRLLPDAARARVAPLHWSHDRSRDVDVVMGAVLAIRASLFHELGGLWPLMYGSENDLAWRIQRRGLAVRFVADAHVMHVGNWSNRKRYPRPGRAARVGRAELAFLAEHYSPWRAEAIRVALTVAFGARAMILRATGHPRGSYYGALARVYARGLPSGARAVGGP
jgi:N-acetylglucosaminyl-diphospho-decaprenol L-rhamnosyltransferase